MKLMLLVGLGSALGGMARFGMVRWVDTRQFLSFPLGTVAVNVMGSAAIGYLASLRNLDGTPWLGEPARAFLLAGVLGGYTTFSAFSLQTLEMLQAGRVFPALTNIGVSVGLCLLAAAVGSFLGQSRWAAISW